MQLTNSRSDAPLHFSFSFQFISFFADKSSVWNSQNRQCTTIMPRTTTSSSMKSRRNATPEKRRLWYLKHACWKIRFDFALWKVCVHCGQPAIKKDNNHYRCRQCNTSCGTQMIAGIVTAMWIAVIPSLKNASDADGANVLRAASASIQIATKSQKIEKLNH
jgi:hypothetical protein